MTRRHPAIGIDLGTTYSAVAFVDAAGRTDTIRNSEGGLTTASAIFFDRTHPIVGLEAIEAGLHEPERLAQFAKRDVGEQQYRKTIQGKSFPPEVLQALVLRKLKEDAELKLGKIDRAVITVPAFFNEPCRKATQDAGRLAGLEVLDIINEPTAAAICFGVEQGFLSADGKSEKDERVLVYDLGGGTFDVTVMEIKHKHYRTIATNGDVYLGGLDWDRRIVDHLAEAFLDQHGIDPRKDPSAEQELMRKANQAKHSLTQRESVSLQFSHEGHRIRMDLDRETFKRLSEDLLERTLMTIGLVLDEAAITWSDLTRLILVGGSTRMPMIRDELSKLSGMELDRSLSPDEAVCHGAAIYAGILLGQGGDSFSGVSVTNVNSHDLGVLAVDSKTGQPRRQLMIARNSELPASKQIRFRTHVDGQENVKVQVVEGGDDKGTNATSIGKCLVDNLPPNTPKGTSVDVQFDYAQDGRLTVSAQLPQLDCAAEMTMNRAAGMSKEVFQSWKERIEAGLSTPDQTTVDPPTQPVAEAATSDEPISSPAARDESATPEFNAKPKQTSSASAKKKKSKKKSPAPEKIDIGVADAAAAVASLKTSAKKSVSPVNMDSALDAFLSKRTSEPDQAADVPIINTNPDDSGAGKKLKRVPKKSD